jgi:hypothetical protein
MKQLTTYVILTYSLQFARECLYCLQDNIPIITTVGFHDASYRHPYPSQYMMDNTRFRDNDREEQMRETIYDPAWSCRFARVYRPSIHFPDVDVRLFIISRHDVSCVSVTIQH